MSRVTVFQCDGPACLHTSEDAQDEDDLIVNGWLIVTFLADDADEPERIAHLHSHECLVAWASEGGEP